MSRHRNWCFTWNNPPEDALEQLKAFKGLRYFLFCKEIAPTTGTPHLQGFIILGDACTFTSLKARNPNVSHWEKMLGKPIDSTIYCTKEAKDDSDVYEYGDPPAPSGSRTDIQIVKQIITNQPAEGAAITMRSISAQVTSYQAIRHAELLFKYHEKPRTWKPYVIWYYGSTGTGKSRTAYEITDDPYTCMSTNRWFEGYDAHDDIIIDDMRKDFARFSELLRLLDRYAVRVETKGGSRQFLGKRIIITSCYSPEEMFRNRVDEDIGQLVRRIDEIIFLGDDIPNQDAGEAFEEFSTQPL